MITLRIKITNRSGLHARPAAIFVQTTRKFQSTKIIVKKGDKIADGKNMIQLLSLAIDFGDEIEIMISGNDEETAATEINKLLTEVLPSIDK